MKSPCWTDLVSRIVPQQVDDLDELTRTYDERRGDTGNDIFSSINPVLHCHNSFTRPDTVCVGLRVSATLPDAYDRAMRLATLAAEEDLEVIVLALTDVTGLEHFGFRIERIADVEREARELCEEQVMRFWSIDLVL
jgi:hypothetical protein